MRRITEKLLIGIVFLLSLSLAFLSLASLSELEFTGDAKMFIGSASQATLSNLPFPMNVDYGWELKPVGNRLVIFAFYTIGNIFSNQDPAIKLLGALFVVIVSIFFIRSITYNCEIFFEEDWQRDVAIYITIFALLSLNNFCLFQAEWFAVIGSLILLSMLLSNSRWTHFLAGLIAIGIISLKGSTIFLIPAIFAAYILLDIKYEKEFFCKIERFAFGIGTGIGISIVLCYTVFKNAIPDMLLAVQVAWNARPTHIDLPDSPAYLLHSMVPSALTIPMLLPGIITLVVICEIVLLPLIIRNGWKVKKTVIALIIMWVVPLIAIMIQGEFFAYHYVMLLFPAIVTLILSMGVLSIEKQLPLLIISLTIGGLIWFGFCSNFSESYMQQETFWKSLKTENTRIDAKFHISSEPEVLFLDSGDAPYYFRAKSACRYSSPIVIQRNMTTNPVFQEQINCISNYKGKYVITEWSWLNNEMIKTRIENNYFLVDVNPVWGIYERKWGFYDERL